MIAQRESADLKGFALAFALRAGVSRLGLSAGYCMHTVNIEC